MNYVDDPGGSFPLWLFLLLCLIKWLYDRWSDWREERKES